MSTRAIQRVLPPDVYDALELSAYAYGGIGAGMYSAAPDVPWCIFGHAKHLDGDWDGPVNDALVVTVDARLNDRAVESTGLIRVPWKRYCRLLGIVRGEA